jgi:hypothetical protein
MGMIRRKKEVGGKGRVLKRDRERRGKQRNGGYDN